MTLAPHSLDALFLSFAVEAAPLEDEEVDDAPFSADSASNTRWLPTEEKQLRIDMQTHESGKHTKLLGNDCWTDSEENFTHIDGSETVTNGSSVSQQ